MALWTCLQEIPSLNFCLGFRFRRVENRHCATKEQETTLLTGNALI